MVSLITIIQFAKTEPCTTRPKEAIFYISYYHVHFILEF